MSTPKNKFSNWTFGIYRAKNPGRAVLGITFPAAEDGSKQTLILDAAKCQKPKDVAEELFNAGAIIDINSDLKSLADAIAPKNCLNGRYITKLGVIGENFFTPAREYGPPVGPYLIEHTLLDRATIHFSSKGSLEDWSTTVLELSGCSSFLMFAIMQAFAAPLLGRVASGADEGFIINLAGDTSRGKTTTLMVGKSVSGSPFTIPTWKNSERSLIENAAALSDTLFAIDDLDKISSKSSFASNFSELTHLLTSGVSKGYAKSVQKTLPNLSWTCCGMTCARATIDELSDTKRYVREGNERVRCIDINVPGPKAGGIWDRCEHDENSAELTTKMQKYLMENHGTALPQWLKCIYADSNTVKEASELAKHFLTLVDLNQNDGISHRVAKKFGLVYAAGILALEHNIIQWSRDLIEEVVLEFYDEATKTLHSVADEVELGFQQIHKSINDKTKIKRFARNMRPTFNRRMPPQMFIVGTDDTTEFCIQRDKFNDFFISMHVANAALEQLKKNRALISRSSQKRISLTKATKQERKFRYTVINLEIFEKIALINGR